MNLTKKNKIIIGVIGILVVGVIAFNFIYKSMYKNTFYNHTYINGVNVSQLTLEEAQTKINNASDSFEIKKGSKTVTTLSLKDDMKISYNLSTDLQNIKNKQDKEFIVQLIFNKKNYGLSSTKVNQTSLVQKLKSESFINSGNNDKTENAKLKYNTKTKKMDIVEEHYGKNYNAEDLSSKIVKEIKSGATNINLNESKYYVQPTVFSDDENLKTQKEQLDKVVGASITVTGSGNKLVINADVYKDWFVFKDNKATLPLETVKKYVNETMAPLFDTYGKTFTFTGADGVKITANKGTLGGQLNVEKEATQLRDEILNKKTLNRKVNASYNGNDTLGSTYVLVNIEKQNVKVYKDGKLLADAPVVTGALWGGRATTRGSYYIFKKMSPAVLRSYRNGVELYASPVTYWMPFNRGQGLHDARWRGVFGGTIYKRNGSHGCVNMQKATARICYENLDIGTPVIVI